MGLAYHSFFLYIKKNHGELQMSKAAKIGGAVVIIGAIAGGGVYYVASSTATAINSNIENEFTRLKQILPSNTNIEKISADYGLFESTGKYKFTTTDQDSSMNGDIILSYKVEHGLAEIINSDIKISGDVSIGGEIVKTLKIVTDGGVTQTFSGNIKDNDVLTLDVQHKNISLIVPNSKIDSSLEEGGVVIKLNGGKGHLETSFTTKDTKHTYGDINLTIQEEKTPADTLNLKNISGAYSFNLDKVLQNGIYQGEAKFNVGEINDGTDKIVIKDVSFTSLSNIVSGNYNVKVNSKVGDISFNGLNNINAELDLTVQDLNVKFVEMLGKARTIISKQETLSDKEILEMKSIVTKTLQEGFNVSIDKLAVRNKENSGEFSLGIKVDKISGDNKFSLYKDATLNSEIKISGEYAQPASALIGSILGLEIPNPANPITDFSAKLKYSNGAVTINEVTAKPGITEIITNGLKSADNTLGFEVVEVIPEKVQEETITEKSTEGPKIDETNQNKDKEEVKTVEEGKGTTKE